MNTILNRLLTPIGSIALTICIGLNASGQKTGTDGKELFPIIHNEGMSYADKEANILIDCVFDQTQTFSEGLGLVEKDGKFGFVDTDGKVFIPLTYDKAEPFKEGLAYVTVGELNYFIDTNNKKLESIEFDYANSFRDGLSRVIKNKKQGFIDTSGKIVGS